MNININKDLIEKTYSVHDADRVSKALGIRFECADGHLVNVSCESKWRVITGCKKNAFQINS